MVEIILLLFDIEFVMLKTCLYTYYRYKIADMKYEKCNFIGSLNSQKLTTIVIEKELTNLP